MTHTSREKLAAILPSIAVAAVHFRITLLIATQANIAYQRMFDTYVPLTGSEQVVYDAYKFLSWPIFLSLDFAGHPSNAFPWYWWLMIGFNSLCWGIALYVLYWILQRLLRGMDGPIPS